MDSGVCSAINYVWDVIHTVLSLLISFSICNGQFQIALFLFIFSVVFCFYLFLFFSFNIFDAFLSCSFFLYLVVLVFIAALRLSLVEASGGYSLLWFTGFSLRYLLLLQSMGSRASGLL